VLGAAGLTWAAAGAAASRAVVNIRNELTRDFIGDLNSFILNGYPFPAKSIHANSAAFQSRIGHGLSTTQSRHHRKPILKDGWLPF
jgi:hypothetical protein